MNRSSFIIAFISVLVFSCAKTESLRTDVDEELIQEYLEEKGLDAERDETGLYYIIYHEGVGAADAKPNTSSHVIINYTGYLTNDTIFDSGVLDAQLGGTIPGFQIGIPKLKLGGVAKFIVPSSLGYGSIPITGEDGETVIPANSILIFDVELEYFE